MIEIAKRVQNKRVYALRGGWVDTDRNCPPKLQKLEGLCIQGRVDNNWNSKKKCKNMRVYA